MPKASSRSQKIEPRFHKNVNKQTPTGCWEWIGDRQSNGYGRLSVKGHSTKAHRVSYSLFKGPIPEGKYVLHSCDNRSCVNPEHLFLGDAELNSKDMVQKGRSLTGSRNHKAKLTEDQVIEIRSLLKQGCTIPELANKYDVSQANIFMIRNNESWRHVPLFKEQSLDSLSKLREENKSMKNTVPLPKGKSKQTKVIYQFEVTEEFNKYIADCVKKLGITKRKPAIYGLKQWLLHAQPPGYEKFLDEPDEG